MMVKNVINLKSEFTLQSGVNLADVSQILTGSRDTARQWNNLLRNKLFNIRGGDITVHICPWEDTDWQQYLDLGNRISRLVVWLSDEMEISVNANDNVQIVRYKALDHSERFVIVSGSEIARALVSWSQPSEHKKDGFLGVFISNPVMADMIAFNLDQKIGLDQS